MSRFLDPKYEHLETYTPGEQPKVPKLIKLNTKECPYPTSPKVLAAMEAERDLRLYPDNTCERAVSAIARFYGLSEDQVIVGNGSDEVLAFAFLAFGKKIFFPDISYGFYPVFADLFGCDAEEIPLEEDFTLDPEKYYGLPGTCIIANPNAPTGLALSAEDIRGILEHNRDQLVIIDEAYVDFGAESCVPLIDAYDNLLVIQTFSKSRALAGARIGFAMAQAPVIEDLNRIKYCFNPYNLSREAIAAAAAAMEDIETFEETRGKIMATRERVQKAFAEKGIQTLPSVTNFIFAKTGKRYFEELRERGILVRHFDRDPIREWVRITIGTDEEMDALLKATEEIL